MIQAGLMAEAYGKTPAEIMHADHMAPIECFQFNSDVLQATSQFKKRVRERKREAGGSVGSRRDQKDMIQDQIDRGRDEQNTPSEQMQALDGVMDRRANTTEPGIETESEQMQALEEVAGDGDP